VNTEEPIEHSEDTTIPRDSITGHQERKVTKDQVKETGPSSSEGGN
jgi:hypothetical protein